MKINQLNLIDFGKFKNKNIDLRDGINIIYGNNEAGKTTIHNFIYGMFYGFLRPYVTRAYYIEDHEKYDPWNTSEYRGNLSFEDEKNHYRLERVFTKGKEETKVYLDSTGEDITKTLDMGNTGRILQPGNHFFGFNDVMYSNTISISQLGTRTEENLVKEIKDKLANMTTSLDEDISVEKAVKYLEDREKEIGSLRARTSPYGKTQAEIKKLDRQRKELINKKEHFEDSLERNLDLEIEIGKLNQELEKLALKYKNIIYSQKDKKFNEANKLIKEIDHLEDKIDSLVRYKDLSMDKYSKLSILVAEKQQFEDKMLRIKEEIEATNININKFKKAKLPGKQLENRLFEDFKNYEKLEEKYKKLEDEKKSENINFLKIDLTNNEEKISIYKTLLIIALVVSGASLIGSVLFSKYLYLLINFLSLPLLAYSISNIRRLDSLIKRIEQYISETLIKEEEIEDNLIYIDKDMKSILNKYGLDSRHDLKLKYNQDQIGLLRLEDYKKDLDKLKDEARKLSEELLLTGRDQYNNTQVIKSILDKEEFKDIEEYRLGLARKSDYEEVSGKLSTKKELLDSLLKDTTLEELEEELVGFELEDMENTFKTRDVQKIREEIDGLEEKLSSLNIEKSRLEERIDSFNDYSDQARLLEEKIFRKKEQVKTWDKKLESLELAKSTIKELSKRIHKEFAPVINERVSKIIEKITDGKYNQVKINDELDIKIVDSLSKELIDVDSLSGGTIDQLYFALRYGILSSAENEKLPLILDDCFIQYDDDRLENILKLLYTESENRQVILFTCQRREIDILDSKNLKYNLIEI